MTLREIVESSASRLTDEEIRSVLTTEGVGVLGLPDAEVPYLVPLSFGFDGEKALYFVYLLFGEESRKETLTEGTDRARFLVYRAESMHEWHSVSVSGRLEGVEDTDWEALRSAMENAWHPDLFSGAEPVRGIRGYRLRVEDWTGLGPE